MEVFFRFLAAMIMEVEVFWSPSYPITSVDANLLRMLLCDGYPLQQHNPANDSGVRHCTSVLWFHFPTITQCNTVIALLISK